MKSPSPNITIPQDVPASVNSMRRTFLFGEDRLGHYPEFRQFFINAFDLKRNRLERPGYIRASSGATYELVFIGRSGEPFPSGLEFYALTEALEPLDEAQADRDTWEFLRWVVQGIGAPWTLADAEATGKLYRIPAETRP